MSILNINILDLFANALKNRTICVSSWKSDNIVSAGIIYGVNRSFVTGREGARVDFVDWGARTGIRIYIHKKTPENKRKKLRLYLSFNPGGGGGRIHRHRRIATMTYDKSSITIKVKCIKAVKNTIAYSSPPLHSQKLIFFYWKPATAPSPRRGGGGGFAPLSLPLNDNFSQNLAF